MHSTRLTVIFGRKPDKIVFPCKGKTSSDTLSTLTLNGVAEFAVLPPPPEISVPSKLS